MCLTFKPVVSGSTPGLPRRRRPGSNRVSIPDRLHDSMTDSLTYHEDGVKDAGSLVAVLQTPDWLGCC